MERQFGIGAITTVVIALIGVPVGLLWSVIAPHGKDIVLGHQGYLANAESEAWVAGDGWFALITAVAGVVCAVVAYILARRLGEIPLLVGLAVGGILAAVVAAKVGHQIGLSTFHHLVATSKDGTTTKEVPKVRATGVLVAWPLLAVVVYGLLEAFDVANREPARRALAAGDGGHVGPGESYQVGGGNFDLEATPTGRDVEGGETLGGGVDDRR
jgi:hypothetical protein